MRRFNDLERAHCDLQRRHGRQATRLEQVLFRLHQQTQLKENLSSQLQNAETQIKGLDDLVRLKTKSEEKSRVKIARMKEALLKVGTLQERANSNNKQQCDHITELLAQVDLLKRKLKEKESRHQEQHLQTMSKEKLIAELEE